MADLYSTVVGSTTLGANNRKILGDGASGVGPYTRFGTPQLTALKIVSTAVDETTTPAVANSNLQKIINAVQGFAEVYYIGIPASNFITVIVNANTVNRGGRGASAYGGTDDTGNTTFESMEEAVASALGQSADDVAITEVTLTGGTFA